jgi:hypothetical protein
LVSRRLEDRVKSLGLGLETKSLGLGLGLGLDEKVKYSKTVLLIVAL